ncbi:MAG TPA: hypothetical protein VH724_11790 [Candidatus Angelobacter sp.]|nr:hypothetical protein [Candidatus Angelobacter sp.]
MNVQSNCYRCGHLLDEQIAFCPCCRAPQIKVSKALEQPLPAQEQPGSIQQDSAAHPHPPPKFASPLAAKSLSPSDRIEWKTFIRSATPMAALAAIVIILSPLPGLFIVLPAGLAWTISRYRRHRPAPMRASHGARMGAMMGLLSFGFYGAFFLSPGSQEKLRDLIASRIQEQASHAPDPQSQQVLQWFATPHGFIVITAFIMVFILVIFLAIGVASGAMAVALAKAPNRAGL